jgi:hypothetical protein
MRQKCEAYFTLGDIEEDAVTEAALRKKVLTAGSGTPQAEQITPAALYLTAILEYVPRLL